MKRLTKIGFRKVGWWALNQSGIEYVLEECAEACNILYCFISNNEVLYVGKTVQNLKKRMYGYQNPASSQSTNINGDKEISTLLLSNQQVDIYALPDNGLLHFGDFHVNLAAGLEDSIAKTFNPKWNKTGTAANNRLVSDAGNSAAT